jgi:glycosyltransferase involved in cell wall biosynthesis
VTIQASVLIIAQNAERTLKRCLDSVTAFDEVILVDGGSVDETIKIASSYPNVKVFQNPWPGFIEQRKFSLKQAVHDWCLMIDSDEALAIDCLEEVKRVIGLNKPKAMYRLMRTEYYEGEPIESGFGRSNYQERLFQKKLIDYIGGVHHEHLINGKRSALDHPDIEDLDPKFRILHDQTYTLDDMIMKLPRFSLLIAYEKFEKGRRVGLLEVLLSFPIAFVQVYSRSWRAGRVGLMTSLLEAYHRALVRMIIYNTQHFKGGKVPLKWAAKKLN